MSAIVVPGKLREYTSYTVSYDTNQGKTSSSRSKTVVLMSDCVSEQLPLCACEQYIILHVTLLTVSIYSIARGLGGWIGWMEEEKKKDFIFISISN